MIEAAYCDQIHLEMDKAEDTGIAEIQKEKSYPLRDIDGNALGRIMPDFTVTMKDGTIEIREVKGFFTAEWKWKWALMRYQYTEFVYKVITEADLW